jgi:hypothetical protein
MIGEVSSQGLDLLAPATALSTPIFIFKRRFQQHVTCPTFPPSTVPPTTLKVCNKLLLGHTCIDTAYTLSQKVKQIWATKENKLFPIYLTCLPTEFARTLILLLNHVLLEKSKNWNYPTWLLHRHRIIPTNAQLLTFDCNTSFLAKCKFCFLWVHPLLLKLNSLMFCHIALIL